MAKYEPLEHHPIPSDSLNLFSHNLPELAHCEDPAEWVMIDMRNLLANIAHPDDRMVQVEPHLKRSQLPFLLVTAPEGMIQGILSSSDISGDKPIKVQHEKRITRDEVLVKTIMTPIDDFLALDYADVEGSKVGNIINTLQRAHKKYALVLRTNREGHKAIKGIFCLSQISRQLHVDLTNAPHSAESVAELKSKLK